MNVLQKLSKVQKFMWSWLPKDLSSFFDSKCIKPNKMTQESPYGYFTANILDDIYFE